ncbi:Ribonuclease H-like domain containing protein, partial [Trema orientale]
FGQVYFLKKYDEVPGAFHEFDRKVWMQHDTRVKKFKIEAEHRDIDSLQDLLRPILANLAIPYEYATIYEHSRIGVAERYNIILKYTIQLMYKETLLSKRYWDYALRTASYILNFTPSD